MPSKLRPRKDQEELLKEYLPKDIIYEIGLFCNLRS